MVGTAHPTIKTQESTRDEIRQHHPNFGSSLYLQGLMNIFIIIYATIGLNFEP
jgi:hypothetical protein